MNRPGFVIDGRRIAPDTPPYVVAEMSANHAQDFRRALSLIEAAASSGADAVKLQTFTPDSLTMDCDRPCFRIEGTPWAGRTLYGLYAEAAMPWSWQLELKQAANQLGLSLFSTVFDAAGVDFLESIEVPAIKIASFELVDLPLLRRVASTGKPVILSTGMATLAEIEEAVKTIREAGGSQLALLKCTSAYPASAQDMNLRAIPHLAGMFGVPTGLSDHSLELAVPVAAVALGACIVEKHLTLSRDQGGLDAAFSLEPEEFRQMAQAVRTAHAALGTVRYGDTPGEAAGRRLRRSLFAAEDIAAGATLTTKNIRCLRPAAGLAPRYLDDLLGRSARVAIPRGTPLDADCLL